MSKTTSVAATAQLVSSIEALRGSVSPTLVANVRESSFSDKSCVIIDKGMKETIELAIAMSEAGCRTHVQLFGGTGSGKSTIARYILEEYDRTYVRVQCSKGMDSEELIGSTVTDPNSESGFSFQWGVMIEAAKNGWAVILEEIDSLNPDKSFHLFPLLDDSPEYTAVAQGHSQQIIKHPNFMVIATSNTNGSGENSHLFVGTEVMNKALLRRFVIKYDVPYLKPKDEADLLMRKTGINSSAAEALALIGAETRTEKFLAEASSPVSTAHLIGLAQAMVANEEKGLKLSPLKMAELTFINEFPTETRVTLRTLIRNRFGK
jgi:cobaltochelatase CobS